MAKTVDLSDYMNGEVQQGHPADFPISLRPVYFQGPDGEMEAVSGRFAVVRDDIGKSVAIVSDRYALIPHQRILDTMEKAISAFDIGSVPRGIYMDRQGARMRALYKFPSLAKPVFNGDDICPCLKIENSYDATSRIAIHIGAFRYVCTNLAVGGGGLFASGFVSIHAGEIPIEEMAEKLTLYLNGFEAIAELYRFWTQSHLNRDVLPEIFQGVPKRHSEQIFADMSLNGCYTVYQAYNVATRYATHNMRTYRTAFDLLERVNQGFQKHFPLS